MSALVAVAEPSAPAAEEVPHEHGLRVLVVEEQDLLQWGLRVVLGRQPWVERCVPARTAAEAVERARRLVPHVVIMDVVVGGQPGTLIAQLLRHACPSARILFLTGDDGMSARCARAAGASGCVSKLASADAIVAAVERVAAGRTMFGSAEPGTDVGLSRRERDVLRLLASGATNPEIAQLLHLSRHTVKQHTSSVYRKLGVRNRTAAAQEAQRLGFVA
jgi:DNA-binding NarL/FixJ family response regulator